MKLVMVTVVEEFQKEVLQLFKKTGIENFSESDIEGFKNSPSIVSASNWFSGQKSSIQSLLFFSFTEEEKANLLFEEIKLFNQKEDITNPIKLAVLPIEKFI